MTVYITSPFADLPFSYSGAVVEPLGRSALGFGYRVTFPISAPAR